MNVRKFLRDLAGLDDPPHKIAMGLALGIFVGFVPIMGIQMAVVLPFALLFRGNKTAAIGGVWITNPITVIPIYYMNYKVGMLFLDYPPLVWADFQGLFTNITLDKFLKLGGAILAPLFTGGLAVAIVASIPTYFITRHLVTRARERRARRQARADAS
jgi:hypothetical protein